ncbi:hypothetical protein RJ640_003264 [Escallonia rubra]|uniref:FAE domain-containing protein n=1 Tax=Escallonia rubra TaxID=112253 RepID=A0AA88R701_9ASTE|nr:hypothetical protein RJ640_003264 [Escallonia rubra]
MPSSLPLSTAQLQFDDTNIDFQTQILEKSGFSEETCLHPSLCRLPRTRSLSLSIEEAATVMFSMVAAAWGQRWQLQVPTKWLRKLAGTANKLQDLIMWMEEVPTTESRLALVHLWHLNTPKVETLRIDAVRLGLRFYEFCRETE